MEYTQEEKISRGYMAQAFPTLKKDYSGTQDSWDVSGKTSTGKYIGEVKVRELFTTAHTTAFLELKKYNAVKEIADPLELTMFYFNVYYDDTLVWNLSLLPIGDYQKEKRWLPKSSTEPWKGYEWKDIIHLPIEAAQMKKGKGSDKMEKLI